MMKVEILFSKSKIFYKKKIKDFYIDDDFVHVANVHLMKPKDITTMLDLICDICQNNNIAWVNRASVDITEDGMNEYPNGIRSLMVGDIIKFPDSEWIVAPVGWLPIERKDGQIFFHNKCDANDTE